MLCSTQIEAQQVTVPCPQIEIYGPQKISFSVNEQTLICGAPEDPAYQTIPLFQAQILLKGFLQARGYLNADVDMKFDKLVAQTKEKTFIKRIQINQRVESKLPRNVQTSLDSLFKDQVLNPQQLNLLESEVKRLLRQQGLACVQVKTQALAQTGVIFVNLENDNSMFFGNLDSEKIQGLHSNALKRLYPFKKGQPYRLNQLVLAEKRFLRSGIVEGSYFQEICPKIETSDQSASLALDPKQREVDLVHRFLEGPPRLIRFGIGLSSEVGPMTRARWSHQRNGEMASYRELNLQASFRSQEARALMDEFLWSDIPRRSLYASIELKRDSQEDYEELSLSLRPHLKWTRDSLNHSWQWRIGPTFSAGKFRTENSLLTGSEDYSSTSLEGLFQTMSHIYEIFDIHPEDGHTMALSFDLRHPDLGFKRPLALGHFTALKIKPLSRLGRGQLIAAARLNLSSTWVEENVLVDALPPSVKHYGGGSDDLRGYRLNTLPKNDGVGALTKLGLKMELRKTHTFHPTLESVFFVDMMKFGERSFELDPTIWISPGVGLRWLSPIGLLQTYVAQGLSREPKRNDGQLFFIGIGGGF